jgi:uncharacterized C2H2 Zn-finger protein
MSDAIIRSIDGREFLEHPTSKLRVPRKTVSPAAGEIWMRCGRCGGMALRPLMRPAKGGSARVIALVCSDSRGGGCMAVYKLDRTGCLEGGGSVKDLDAQRHE